MTKLVNAIARLTARKPLALWLVLVGLVGGCASILSSRQSFDTDVLNLLPHTSGAVQGLKIFNREFSQGREVTFVIRDSSDAGAVTAFHEIFVDRLRAAPWAVRVLDGSPLETVSGRSSLADAGVAFLLNLPPEDFAEAIKRLDPEVIRERLIRLHSHLAAGSPAAMIELESDPLGLLALAAKPLWKTSALNETLDLVSPDERTRIVPVVTNQPTLGADDCKALMRAVHAFVAQVRADFGPNAPDVLVTGRSAFVDEIARSMRRDILFTSLTSLAAVTALFWFSFRRLLPLLGLTVLLALSAALSLAIGILSFQQVNVIAIGFCSILFGVGDDFGLLLFQSYRAARHTGAPHEAAIAAALREMMPGIFWVALTTAIGFAGLNFSGSAGFAQLGTLVGAGVFICAGLFASFLFLFVRADSANATTAPAYPSRFRILVERPWGVLIPSAGVLAVLCIIAASPFRPLRFDTSPHSLEPRNAPAAKALDAISHAFPGSFQPVIAVVPASSVDEAAVRVAKIEDRLDAMVRDGTIATYASPSALILSPSRIRENSVQLESLDIARVKAAVSGAIAELGFNASSFESTFSLLGKLQEASMAGGPITWASALPPPSPWWFLADRMLSPESPTALFYIRTSHGGGKSPTASELEAQIQQAGAPVFVTGWTQTLESLIPWAERELAVFGGGVFGLILLVLVIVYRDWRLWFVHVSGLVLAMAATVATFKLLHLGVNLLNVLAFPLMLAVGVDYGIHLLLGIRHGTEQFTSVAKPVLVSGLTTVSGFASLVLATNPALNGLGTFCAIGVAASLAVSFLFVTPAAVVLRRLARGSNAA